MAKLKGCRIGFNLLFLIPGETGGMEVYAKELLAKIIDSEPDASFFVYLNSLGYEEYRRKSWPSNVHLRRARVSGKSRIMRTLYEGSVLTLDIRRDELDVLHSLGNTAPPIASTKLVTTIHDINYKHFPSAYSRVMRLGQNLIIPVSIKRAERIVNVIQFFQTGSG